MGGRLRNANICLSNFICSWLPWMALWPPWGARLRNAVLVIISYTVYRERDRPEGLCCEAQVRQAVQMSSVCPSVTCRHVETS